MNPLPKTKSSSDESFIFIGILNLYNRFLGFLLLFGLFAQLFVYWRNFRWHWPLTLCSYDVYSLLNALFWGMALLSFYLAPSFFALPIFLKRILPYLKYKHKAPNTKQKRSTPQIFLILYFLISLIRFSIIFWSALFAVMVLLIGALSVQLYFNPLYWLNGLPLLHFFYLFFAQKPSSTQFQYWLALSIKPSLTQIKEQLYEEES